MILATSNYEIRGKVYYPPHQSIDERTVKCQEGVDLGNDVWLGDSLRERQAVHCAGGVLAVKHSAVAE